MTLDDATQDSPTGAASATGQEVVIVTGPSGAGRSTAINALEDFGFEAIDNLPITLIPRLFSGAPSPRPIAIGVDARTRGFSGDALAEMVDDLGRSPELNVTLLFLDCSTDALLRRYSETRRRHPMAPDSSPLSGIDLERAMLSGLRSRADALIDTSEFSPHDLRAELARWFGHDKAARLSVLVQSFSYKRGIPRGLDMALDVRFLRNPHWEAALRPLTGLDASVADHVRTDPRFAEFFERTLELMRLLLPAYKAEGKSYFSIGLGCTGGQHRSVFVTESLALRLAEDGWQVSTRHRELERRMGDVPRRTGGSI